MKLIKKIIFILFLVIVIVGGLITLYGYRLYKTSIDEVPLSVKIAEIRSNEDYTTFDKLPKNYTDAVVSVEDRRFYSHGPVDFRSIGRAIVSNFRQKEFAEGGSTITQQLAKNLYFIQKPVIERKVAEIFLAYDLEKNYSKQEILELYVNTSYFGDGYYCIRKASLGYFNKLPIEMNLDECTLIAGVPNAPSVYAPTKNMNLARKRQEHVLKSMVTNNYISQEEADSIIQTYNNEK